MLITKYKIKPSIQRANCINKKHVQIKQDTKDFVNFIDRTDIFFGGELSNQNTRIILDINAKKLSPNQLEKIYIMAIKTNNKLLVNSVVNQLVLLNINNDNNPYGKADSLRVLGNIGSKADKKIQDRIFNILTEEVQGTEENNVEVRSSSIQALGSIAANAKSENRQDKIFNALTKEGQGINHYNISIRTSSITALGKIAANTKSENMQDKIFNALTKEGQGIKDEDQYYVRPASVKALGDIGARANEKLRNKIFDALQQGLNDPSNYVRVACFDSLCRVGVNADDGMQNNIVDFLKNRGINNANNDVQEAALVQLGELGSHCNAKLQNGLYKLLTSSQQGIDNQIVEVRRGAVSALGYIGANAKSKGMQENIIDVLSQKTKDKNIYVKKVSLAALANIGANTNFEDMQEKIFDLLSEDSDENRVWALASLGTNANIKNEKLRWKVVDTLIKNKQAIKIYETIKSIHESFANIGSITKDAKLVNKIVNELIDNKDIDNTVSFVKAASIEALKKIALEKGDLDSDDQPINGKKKTIFTKVLEKVKEIRTSTENKDIYTEALVAEMELEAKKVRYPQKLLRKGP